MSNLSITQQNAKIYIARPIGGAGNAEGIALAGDCLLRGFNDWQQRDWEYLLRDNVDGFTVASCVLTSGSPTVTAPSANTLDGVNIGVTVTGSGTGIPAGTTVLSYTRNADGSIASITLSANATASETVTLTFSGNIPIIAGVQDYNLPTDFYRHYGARLLTNIKWGLEFVRPREWNRKTLDQTIRSTPTLYTIFNPKTALTQNKGVYRLRLYPVPATADTLKLEYYRRFDTTADPLDMEASTLYEFLDYCRNLLILTKRSFDDPDSAAAQIKEITDRAKARDEEVTEDEDIRLKSQIEMGSVYNKPLYTNGEFDIY